MTIGIISAMQVESERIRKEMTIRQEETIAGQHFVSGEWLGREVVVAVCGVGKVSAAMCTQTMILHFAPSLILNTGVAGAIAEELSLLDVVIAEKTVQHDVDTTAVGDPLGMISGINKVFIPCHYAAISEKVDEMVARRPDVRLGTIASGDQFVADRERAREIRRLFQAMAVDMESGAIGQVCYIAGTPCCIIRTISDAGSNMEYITFVGKAAKKSIEILRTLLA